MKADRIIAAEQLVTLTGYIASDLSGQDSGKRSLPSPKIIIGVLAFFGGLSWVASWGQQPARVASTIGAVVTLVFLMRPVVTRTFTGLAGTLTGFLSTSSAAPTAPAPTGPAGPLGPAG